ncbi:argininosuccinate lyase, partial [Halobacterium salinarum]|nr:argininosuccinate lyase [Halobacterium salinarum]
EPAAVADALDPVGSVAARDSAGGPAPAAVEAAVADVRDGIDADEAALAAERASLADAADALAAEVSGYV